MHVIIGVAVVALGIPDLSTPQGKILVSYCKDTTVVRVIVRAVSSDEGDLMASRKDLWVG